MLESLHTYMFNCSGNQSSLLCQILPPSLHDVRITLNVCTAEDVEFSEAVKPIADWIVNELREQ